MQSNLEPPEASERLKRVHGLKRSPRTLANLRYHGGGPKYFRPSPIKVLYPVAELDAWAQEKLGALRSHTAEETNPNA